MATTILRKAPEWKKMQESRDISYVLMEDAWVLHPGCVRFHAQCILGKRCAPCLRASSASCLQSPATIYPHLQAASSICSSATLPSYSRWRILPPPTKIQLFITSHGQIIPAEIVETIFMSDISTSVTLARTLPLDLPQLRLLPVALLQLSLWSGSRRINLPFPFPQWNNSSQEQATFVPKNRPAPPLSQVTNYICPEM